MSKTKKLLQAAKKFPAPKFNSLGSGPVVITCSLGDNWEEYKENVDGVFYEQKGGPAELPHMAEVHEGIEDLSEYYASVGIPRHKAADYIASHLSQDPHGNWNIPKLDAVNHGKFCALLCKLQDIVDKYPAEAYRYFD